MPFNLPGLLVPFQLLFNPRLVLPALTVKDIRYLDFTALRNAGYRGAVFDKDNCLTLPSRDGLVPELTDAWKECRDAFGEGNVLIVSNSAGTKWDTALIQAESVTNHLRVPVLRHASLKPSYRCISGIRTYFLSLPRPIADHELIVVGDRIFTDVVMANRMKPRRAQTTPETSSPSPAEKQDAASSLPFPHLSNPEKANAPLVPLPSGPLAIYTSGVWQRESMAMRWVEKTLIESVRRFTKEEPDRAIEHAFINRTAAEMLERQERENNSWRSRILRTFGRR
ncbi:HAD phosphatase [Punctularia strigosozonata HHB-11173 SS5]|uniref:HAD phosphatase n=1 Tax=Punctularia strigosozonata (strain HHB-11173) TaxID=741275 RepID=UPI00044181B4|nr:HAD phosphatase [Punctularia strigosozonata HHB-11173 SS5]EIN06779.1 HAD phosphatase [Punctularia strigosozonata HHB-11173 SS5]